MSWSKKRDLQKQIDVTLDAVEASVSRSHSTKEKSNTTHVQPKHITSSNLDTFINDGIVSILERVNPNYITYIGDKVCMQPFLMGTKYACQAFNWFFLQNAFTSGKN